METFPNLQNANIEHLDLCFSVHRCIRVEKKSN